MEDIAYVTEIDGKIVLVDPEGAAFLDVVLDYNFKRMFETHQYNIDRFRQKLIETNRTNGQHIVVIANVDTEPGNTLAKITMQGHDWDQYRNRGEIPFARGIVSRELAEDLCKVYHHPTFEVLKNHPNTVFVLLLEFDTIRAVRLL